MFVVSVEDRSCFASALVEVHLDHEWRVCEVTKPFYGGIRHITMQQFESICVGESSLCDVRKILGAPPKLPDSQESTLEYVIVEGASHWFVNLSFSADGVLEHKSYYTR